MLLFWIALVLFVVSIISAITVQIGDFNTLFMIASSVFLMVSVGLCFKCIDSEQFKQDYSMTLKRIDEYNENTDFELLDELYGECKEIDLTVAENLRYHDNIWIGRGYSEEVANTPSLVSVFNEKFNNGKNSN